MSNNIDSILGSINDALKDIRSYDDSIFKNMGSLLFKTAYARYTSSSIDAEIDMFIDMINNYEIQETKHQTLAEGYPGIGVVFQYMAGNGLVDSDDGFLQIIEDIAIASGNYQLELGNLDLLYGATGIVYYLLLQKNRSVAAQNFIAEYILYLSSNKLRINGGTAWEDYYYRIREGKVGINMGLAHGMPAILKALVRICQTMQLPEDSEVPALIKDACIFLLHAKNKQQHAVSQYGSYWVPGQQEDEVSRLGWCYGDLTLGYILYQAGLTINDEKIKEEGLRIVHRTTSRTEPRLTQVADAGLCHGSAGIAHVYNRMWHYTQDSVFKKAADFWIQKTLDFACHQDGVAGYKRYNPKEESMEDEYGFLEGGAGIGLALLSYITGDCSWDYCLMLND